jgi:glycosyltransferase involved in cell wall biosynthesis
MIENLDLGDIAVISGSTGDVASAMRDMDVFVLPSINEGISNTVLEAMATGIPVLAFRVGGNPELIEHDVSGVLLDRSESDDDANCANLAYAIARYIRDPELRARQGEAARTRAVMKFGLRRMVDEYARLYDEVLQSRRH